jgi:hypothetical protein
MTLKLCSNKIEYYYFFKIFIFSQTFSMTYDEHTIYYSIKYIGSTRSNIFNHVLTE